MGSVEAFELNDDELEAVAGGQGETGGSMTDDEIIAMIEKFYGWLPGDVRNKIEDAVRTYERKAARALAEKLVKGFPNASGLPDLIR